ncbi:MAG: ABC transporter permease [Planctomycetota bacterium]
MTVAWLRPYRSVVADSFHAATASRVLWAAMIAIWVLLLALAPIGVKEDYTTSFRWFDFYNGTRMKALLARGMVDPSETERPLGMLARALPDDLQRKLQRVGEGEEVRIRLDQFADALNGVIAADLEVAPKDPDWYAKDAWSDVLRQRELRDLDAVAESDLGETLRQRRARLRIEAALPGVFEARSKRSVSLTYAGLDFPTELQIDRAQFETVFNQFVIPTLVHWLLGWVLVFLGVLVTASIIPDMLQPGSLHLLLSKPVSRTGLLLSKFVGGCAFVTLCVAQLVLGLYLIAGLRLGIWNHRILWCVPVALVLFAVFFSVSVPAGLRWRSPIISIACAGALAGICLVIGVMGGILDARVVQPDRIRSLLVRGESVFAVTNGGGVVHYEPDERVWAEAIDSQAMSRDRVLTPVALGDDRIATARIRGGRMNPFGLGAPDLVVLSQKNDWKPEPGMTLPTATERLMNWRGEKLLAVNSADLLAVDLDRVLESIDAGDEDETDSDDDSEQQDTDQANAPKPNSLAQWLGNLVTMQGGATDEFASILPPSFVMTPPLRLAPLDSDLGLLLLSRERLVRLVPPGDEQISVQPGSGSGAWQIAARTSVPRGDLTTRPVLVASDQFVLVQNQEGPLLVLDSDSLETIGKIPLGETEPLSLIRVSENAFIMLSMQGRCHRVRLHLDASDSKTPTEETTPTTTVADRAQAEPEPRLESEDLPIVGSVSESFGPKDVQTMLWDGDSEQLLIAHHVDQVDVGRLGDASEKDLQWSLASSQSIRPQRGTWRWIEHYVFGTLRWLTPQVLDLGNTTAGMVSGEDALVLQESETGDADVVRYEILGPMVSCLLFILVWVGGSCFYFSRTDF